MLNPPVLNRSPVAWPGMDQNKPLQAPPLNNPLSPLPEDTFGTVGPIVIKPSGQPNSLIMTKLNAAGQIILNNLNGPELLGNVQPNGNFQLINGIQGNVFNSPYIELPIVSTLPHVGFNVKESQVQLAKNLKMAERQRAVIGSEIPLIRKFLTNRGINGAGIKIGILDGNRNHGEKSENEPSDHSRSVSQTINDPIWGVAPFSQVEQLGKPWNLNNKIESDTPQALATKITNDYLAMFSYTSNQLQSILAKNDPALRVLNITSGIDRAFLYIVCHEILTLEKDKNGYPKYPHLTQSIFGNTVQGSEEKKFQALVNYIDHTIENSPVIQQAYLRYVDMTRQAAAKGIIIVAAAGNENNKLPYPVKTKPGSDLDNLAKSPYVITAAASDSNQTPGAYNNYTVTAFSSRGDGRQWNPTIAAPGIEIGFSKPEGEMLHNLVANGTSFSTPFTCGVIALMLQRNPYLTFDQIKAKLQATAVKTPYYGTADYGAGFLNPIAAVLS